jgi:hypothetical protein
MTSASESGCNPGCPDDDRNDGKSCTDSCNSCVCCPIVARLTRTDSGNPVFSVSTRYRPFSVAFPLHTSLNGIFRPPRSV